MRLSELMSHMDLTLYPEVALVMFLGVFAGVLFYVARGKQSFERHAQLPLENDREVRP